LREKIVERNAHEIAGHFVRGWEDAWNGAGPAAVAALYTPDAVLIGATIAAGRAEVERVLGLIHQQGWTKIAIRLVEARSVDAAVLAISEFTATGSGPNQGKSLAGKSTHVLTRMDDKWLSAMHTAV
jgi:uncharacterized protein (TIGR02246 family)